MPVMRQVRDDEPLMIAWKAYCGGEDYRDAFEWASIENHRDGSLWAAFMAGFHAANPPQETVEAIIERCAKVCDLWEAQENERAYDKRQAGRDDNFNSARASAAAHIAAAIRALKLEQLTSTLNEVGND